MSWLPKQTVVVPTDFSEPSFEAVLLATKMVERSDGLHVINVQVPAPIAEGGAWTDLADQDLIAGTCKALGEQLGKHGVDGATIEVRIGSPGVEIAAYAREIKADLIVIPSHGRTGLKHLLLGSVAECVARYAPCPVLILRRD